MAAAVKNVFTVAAGAQLSDKIHVGAGEIIGFIISGTPVSSQFTIKASDDDSTYLDLYDDNATQLVIKVGAARIVGLRSDQSHILSKFQLLQINMGSIETAGLQVKVIRR